MSFFPNYNEYCLIWRWRAIFFTETAVSNYTGHTEFYTDGETNEKHEWGAGIVGDNNNLMQNSSGERVWWFHWERVKIPVLGTSPKYREGHLVEKWGWVDNYIYSCDYPCYYANTAWFLSALAEYLPDSGTANNLANPTQARKLMPLPACKWCPQLWSHWKDRL